MEQLLVFMGKPGAGKTTLITELFPDKKVMDVKPYVKAYMQDGQVPEEKTEQAYHDMYHAISQQQAVTILEVGTNHPALNVDELLKQAGHRSVHIFICIASAETLRQRVRDRVEQDDMEAMERRIQRDFPATHMPLIERAGLPYSILDMEQPMTDNMILVRQLLRAGG